MGQLFRLKHSPRTCDIVATLHNGPNDKTLFNKFFPLLSTLISLINVEVGINVEGVQNLPNHLNMEVAINVEGGILW